MEPVAVDCVSLDDIGDHIKAMRASNQRPRTDFRAGFNQFVALSCKIGLTVELYSPAGHRRGIRMHLIVNVALIIGFVALLIIGFLSVAHELLSRIIMEARSSSNEAGIEQLDRKSSHMKARQPTPTSSR